MDRIDSGANSSAGGRSEDGKKWLSSTALSSVNLETETTESEIKSTALLSLTPVSNKGMVNLL